ncbi:hypothetical protein PFICI_13537 [Pestalotiopsis fici W106-1]|uniref:Uncharacterized protein n=1 Tax=Pestalotiopsis fici (strain W106-1 / CGMCC3.15140) TaxID=1229662 RepID=W3WMF5_PESFW|nr:uncharacterized protein PFICI_13537 [Pestalotiopsis fici W106-1]ETS75053.1 hypothetical protein PFICI_13537 [Pestalotiopsis fici W106-1]
MSNHEGSSQSDGCDSHHGDCTEVEFDGEYFNSSRYSWEHRGDNIPWCPRDVIEHPGGTPTTSSKGKADTEHKKDVAKGSRSRQGRKDTASKS